MINNFTLGIEVLEHNVAYFWIEMWTAVIAVWLKYFRRPDSACGYRQGIVISVKAMFNCLRNMLNFTQYCIVLGMSWLL